MGRIVLNTERLELRELTLDDLDFMAALVGHAEVMRHYPQVYSRDEARGWIERQLARYERDGHGLWLARLRATGEPAGAIGLSMQEVDGAREPEVGYLLHRAFWGRGYATEAARAVRDQAWNERGFDHVISLIRPANLPSQAVARRLGMRPLRETTFAGSPHLVFRVDRAAAEGA